MNKLYEQDAYLKEFEAEVVSCVGVGDRFAVRLDQTAFFPEGGGQAADVGTIGDAVVSDVQVEGDAIVHYVDRAVDGRVRCAIDWDTRFARMQSHSGEHLLSGLAHRMFGCNNVGFHMSEESVTFDFDRPLTQEQAEELEGCANRAIYENRAVYTVDAKDAGEYRSKLDFTEGVRVVVIEGYDKCACCAPHVKCTGEIGCVKILDCTPHKGGVRLSAVCGSAAYRDYRGAHELRRNLMKRLSASSDAVEDAVARLQLDLAEKTAECAKLKGELAILAMETVRVEDITCGFLPEAGFDTLRACLNTVTDETVALFSASGEYMLRGEDVRELTKELNARFSGKGGGKPGFAQGKLSGTKEEILAFLNGRV